MSDRPKLGKIDPILSGNRFGGPQGGSFDGRPPGLPSDPYFAALHRAAKYRAYALGFGIAMVAFGGMFVAAIITNQRDYRARLEAERAPCAWLALGLRGADNGLARARDELELQMAVGALSVAIAPILAHCMPPSEADKLALQIGEARTAAQAKALIDAARERIENVR